MNPLRIYVFEVQPTKEEQKFYWNLISTILLPYLEELQLLSEVLVEIAVKVAAI